MGSENISRRGVWWGGAIRAAIRGIPQGLLLGALGFGLLVGGLYVASALGLGSAAATVGGSFGSFLFSSTTSFAAGVPTFAWGMLNPLPFIALNTALTMVGNFLTGGDIAVAKYQQEVDHARNEARISAIESREMMLEHAVDVLHPNANWQGILEKGPRYKAGFVAVEEDAAAHAPKDRILH